MVRVIEANQQSENTHGRPFEWVDHTDSMNSVTHSSCCSTFSAGA
jgi:hypothetical protein